MSRLNIINIDAVLLHSPMQLLGKNGEEIWSSLRHNKDFGTINKIGFSIYEPNELNELYPRFKPDIVQFPYNVFDRRIETSGWLEFLHKNKIETHARSVFLQGLLLMNKNSRYKSFLRWKDLWALWDDLLAKKNITALQLDISSEKQCKKIVQTIIKRFKKIDLAVLNAAAYNPGISLFA